MYDQVQAYPSGPSIIYLMNLFYFIHVAKKIYDFLCNFDDSFKGNGAEIIALFQIKGNLHCKHLYCVQVFAVVARNICKLNVLLQGLTDVGGQIFICDLVGKQDHNGDPKRKLPPFISTTLNVLKRFHHVNF